MLCYCRPTMHIIKHYFNSRVKPVLQYKITKCTLCHSEGIEDEYHMTLV